MGIQHTKMNLEQQFNWRKNGPILTLASQDNAFKLLLSQVRLSQLQYEKKYTIYLIIIIMAILLPLQLLSTAAPTPTFYCNPNGMHQKRSRGHWFIRALWWMSPSLCLIRPLRKNPNYKFIQNTPFTIKLLPNCVFLLLLRWIGDSCLREIEMTITSIIIISWTNKYRSNYCSFL